LNRKEVIGDATLYMGDCMEILPTLGDVDAVITDPPFGVGNFVQTTGRKMGRGESRGKTVEWNESGPPPEFFDVLRAKSKHRIIWGANFFNCFEDRGGAIVWDKAQSMPNFSKADIASCTHFQKTEVVRIPWTNFTAAHQAETDHPCERPVALYDWCIAYLPKSIRSVMDPYLGSGSCGVATVRAGLHFIGIEREPRYFDIACRRIEQAYNQRPLFETDPPKPPQQLGLEAA
jgi:site-specific DNA-methyltransferase (adenine-specific)/modification methylase